MKKILLIILTISFCGLTACKTGTKKGGDMDKETLVKIETTLGDIEVKLYNETPKHRDNFIKLVKDGVYEGKKCAERKNAGYRRRRLYRSR